jgi:hypothetical protein
MLKLKQTHTSRDVKILTDQLVDAVASGGGGGSPATPYMQDVLLSANASEAQTKLGMSDFAKTLIVAPDSPAALTLLGFSSLGQSLAIAANASTALTSLGVSSFAKTLIDDANASDALTTLGVSAFAKTVLDDPDAAAARTTLDVPSNANLTAAIAGVSGPKFNSDNYIDNGDFYWWRINSSQTTDNFASTDRWYHGHNGSTKIVTVQEMPNGQTAVPPSAITFARTVVTSVAGANNRTYMRQPIINSATLAGKTATLTFYAKADAARPIVAEFCQFFGNTPTASAAITGLGATKFNLTTAWQKCQLLVSLPSVSGKKLNPAQQDTLDLNFWFEAGTNYAARTLSLGQQSGTFDITHVSLVEGDATAEPDPFKPRDFYDEKAELAQYYNYIYVTVSGYGPAGGTNYISLPHLRTMRVAPSVYFYSTTYSNATAVTAFNTSDTILTVSYKVTALGASWCQTGIEFYANAYGGA